ncbi:MAG TPA: entericidin A/B family lipoprotein [Burkholderiaceae bacterium]
MKHRTGLVIAATAALLAGCNTLEGIGKDLSKAGEASENAPQKK